MSQLFWLLTIVDVVVNVVLSGRTFCCWTVSHFLIGLDCTLLQSQFVCVCVWVCNCCAVAMPPQSRPTCWTSEPSCGWRTTCRSVPSATLVWKSGENTQPRANSSVTLSLLPLPQTWQSTILVVSHDRNFLNAVVTDIIHLHSQRLDSYRGDYENFIKTKEDRLKNQQREYEAQQQYRQHIQVLQLDTRAQLLSNTHTHSQQAFCLPGVHRQVSLQCQQSCSGAEQTEAAGEAVS